MWQDEDKEEREESDDEETAEQKLSKRKRKEANRLKIAELKQTCPRPEVVEVWDVTAQDPKLLVYLKVGRPSTHQASSSAPRACFLWTRGPCKQPQSFWSMRLGQPACCLCPVVPLKVPVRGLCHGVVPDEQGMSVYDPLGAT